MHADIDNVDTAGSATDCCLCMAVRHYLDDLVIRRSTIMLSVQYNVLCNLSRCPMSTTNSTRTDLVSNTGRRLTA